MNKIYLAIFLIAALVLVSGCAQAGQKLGASPTPATSLSQTPVTSPAQTPNEFTIEMTQSVPILDRVTVKAGVQVTFLNKDSTKHWPASAVHPTHKAYPGSDIAKCNDPAEKTKIFDACKGLEQGESWSFTFTEKGVWKYHDHLNPGLWGEIVVE